VAKEPPFGDDQGSHPQVWVYAVLVAGIVAAALFRLLPRWPGLAQEVALPPLDFFADVRALMARGPSIPVFAVGVIATLVARAALLATIIGFTRRRIAFALRFYLAALAPAVLAAGLDFSGRAILYAYLIWAGLLLAIVTFGALGAAPWGGRDTLHGALARAARHGFRSGTLALYLVALAIVGGVWRRPGEASQVLVVPLSGALTAFMARRLSVAPSRLSLRRVAIVATAAVVVIAAIGIAVPRLGGSSDLAIRAPRRGSLLLIAGVDTSTGKGALFKFDPRAVGFSCRQTFYYSYRGPGRGGPQGDARCPIVRGAPYSKADTTRPLRQLVSALRAQLTGLPAPVVVVTHSQGAWIAWSEITADHDASVNALVMLAPFNEGLAPYPPTGADGAGAAGGAAVRLVTDLGRSLGINEFDPDAPLARELQATPGAVERLVARRLPRTVRGAAVLARADLPLEPRPWPHGLPEACPGWLTHAALPTSSRVAAVIDRFLQGHRLSTCPRWVTALGHATDAFGTPTPAASDR
jgi:hypothetical protein